jgi:hypothetical protein
MACRLDDRAINTMLSVGVPSSSGCIFLSGAYCNNPRATTPWLASMPPIPSWHAAWFSAGEVDCAGEYPASRGMMTSPLPNPVMACRLDDRAINTMLSVGVPSSSGGVIFKRGLLQ